MGRETSTPPYPTIGHGDLSTVLEADPWPPPELDARLQDGLRFVFTALAVRGHRLSRVRLRFGRAREFSGEFVANAVEILALDGVRPDLRYAADYPGRELVKALQGLWEEWEARGVNEGPHFVRSLGRLVPDRAPTPTIWLTVRP